MHETAAQVRCWDCGAACPEWQASRQWVATGYSSGWSGRLFYNRVTLCSWCSRRRRRSEDRRLAWKLVRRAVLLVVVVSLFNQCRAAFDRIPAGPAVSGPGSPAEAPPWGSGPHGGLH